MIQVEPLGDVAVIRLDRPEKRNALTPKMLASLRGAVDRASSARAIVLSGVGDVFCAGFDLSLCRDDEVALTNLLEGLSRAIRSLRTAPCPVVVSAHGAAIAGGCALLGGADFVITNTAAKLGYPVLRLGISPAVSYPTLAAAIGHGPARARLLDPHLISGEAAMRIGLVHECVESPAACEARAIALAHNLAEKPPHALAYTKRWLDTLADLDNDAAYEAALAASLACVGSPEQQERLAAMWSKEGTS